jgi:predicted lactoylglutathione lyase
MLALLAAFFPIVLLGGVLGMERIERQFADQTVGDQVMTALANAPADEVESLVSNAAQGALDRHWRQHARRARLASAYPFSRG